MTEQRAEWLPTKPTKETRRFTLVASNGDRPATVEDRGGFMEVHAFNYATGKWESGPGYTGKFKYRDDAMRWGEKLSGVHTSLTKGASLK